MMPDLTKLVLHSGYPAFMNNNVFIDSFNISGTISAGVNTVVRTIDLGFNPDLSDILIGQNGEWSKEVSRTGFSIVVPGVGSSSGAINTLWAISTQLNANNLTITAFNVHTVAETVTLTTSQVDVRVVDYSDVGVTDKLVFDSRRNYMKRGSESIGLTGNDNITLITGTSTLNITHNLGYIPFFVVGAHLTDDYIIWSNNRMWEYTDSESAGTNRPVTMWHRCNTNRLEINIVNGSGTNELTGTKRIWWAIYLDYS